MLQLTCTHVVVSVVAMLCLPVARATTHSDLLLQAQQQGVQWRVVHNASILTAVGACGLQVSGWYGSLDPPSTPPPLFVNQLYTFGETVSLVMWTSSWQPDSYVDKIERNLSHGLHTLCLLGGWVGGESEGWV